MLKMRLNFLCTVLVFGLVFCVNLSVAHDCGCGAHEHEHPVDHSSAKETITQEFHEFKEHIKELRTLTETARINQKLSALAFYQDFVVNTKLGNWSWLCDEFLTEDVNMTVYTTNATYTHIHSEYANLSAINFVGCQNVTKFYDATISTMFGYMYHPYANPWIEIFENGTANSLVSGMNNAVVNNPKDGSHAAFWSFAYYAFGWVKLPQGWRINRFDHLSAFTVPYQGTGWSSVPTPFTGVYQKVLKDYPVLGKHFAVPVPQGANN